MILLIVLFAVYFLLVLLLMIGWRIALTRKPAAVHDFRNFKVTVVVPFRNEEQNIANIISDLVHQKYDHHCFEVLLCNDHSTDDSVPNANKAIVGYPNFKVMNSPDEGKKQALAYAIENTEGEIIVTTDADCRIPESWLTRINSSFQNPRIKMVFGGVKIQEDKVFFSKLQAMEFASLIGSGAATLSLGFPTMCNGANLAFLRSAFFRVGGYVGNLNIPSGDDEFLMRKISETFPGSICFLNAPDAVVTTKPQDAIKEFVHQRLRWAGKWKHNSSVYTIVLAGFILVIQTCFLALLFRVAFTPRFLPITSMILGIKLVLEGLFLFQVSSFLRVRWRGIVFLILQFLYPVYVIFIGIMTNFTSFTWKGREWQHKK